MLKVTTKNKFIFLTNVYIVGISGIKYEFATQVSLMKDPKQDQDKEFLKVGSTSGSDKKIQDPQPLFSEANNKLFLANKG
jgi:hypothetical protein